MLLSFRLGKTIRPPRAQPRRAQFWFSREADLRILPLECEIDCHAVPNFVALTVAVALPSFLIPAYSQKVTHPQGLVVDVAAQKRVIGWLDAAGHKDVSFEQRNDTNNSHHCWRALQATAIGIVAFDDVLYRFGIQA